MQQRIFKYGRIILSQAILIALTLVLAVSATAQSKKQAKATEAKSGDKNKVYVLPIANNALLTKKDTVSYSIGIQIGKNLVSPTLDIDIEKVIAGLRASFSGGTLAITEEAAMGCLSQLQAEMQQKQQEESSKAAMANKEKADKYLAENKNKPGVITTASGLQYIVIKQGTGAKPADTSKAVVNYTGTFTDGRVFDSSEGREPFEFDVKGGVIPGWIEAVKLMNVGSKLRLFIPPDLAYGERGAGGVIGPNELLIFEVELIGLK